ncbi:MAG: IPTL-CTERM sorting domain-containing protein [Chitinophagales bacterium]
MIYISKSKSLVKERSFVFSLLVYFLLVGNTSYVLAQPANSAFADAIDILSSSFNHTVTIVESDASVTNETNENLCGGGFYSGNWWYKISTASAGTLTASAIMTGATGSPANTNAVSVCIYSGSGFPLNEEDGQSAFSNSTVNPMASITTTPGTTYYISVGNNHVHTSIGDIVTTITFPGTIGIVANTNSVPTLSQWGLIILALLFMTSGTLYLLQSHFEEQKG